MVTLTKKRAALFIHGLKIYTRIFYDYQGLLHSIYEREENSKLSKTHEKYRPYKPIDRKNQAEYCKRYKKGLKMLQKGISEIQTGKIPKGTYYLIRIDKTIQHYREAIQAIKI